MEAGQDPGPPLRRSSSEIFLSLKLSGLTELVEDKILVKIHKFPESVPLNQTSRDIASRLHGPAATSTELDL